MAKELDFSNFAGIRKTIMSCRFSEEVTQEEKEQLFQNLVRILIEKNVCKRDGSTFFERDTCLDYILDIIPKLEEDELFLISTNREGFYSRFCFSPTTNVNSLYSHLKKLAEKQGTTGYYKNIPIKEVFEDYTQETGLSPYELPDEDWLVEMYLSNIDEVAIYDLGYYE